MPHQLTQEALLGLVDAGVFAYKSKEFKSALEKLQRVLDVEPQNWRAKLYLAMSYYHSGEIFTAYRHFLFLRDNCTDSEIRGKAESALAAMSSQMQASNNVNTSTYMPEMTCTFKKPVAEDAEDGSDLEWVDESTKRK